MAGDFSIRFWIGIIYRNGVYVVQVFVSFIIKKKNQFLTFFYRCSIFNLVWTELNRILSFQEIWGKDSFENFVSNLTLHSKFFPSSLCGKYGNKETS